MLDADCISIRTRQDRAIKTSAAKQYSVRKLLFGRSLVAGISQRGWTQLVSGSTTPTPLPSLKAKPEVWMFSDRAIPKAPIQVPISPSQRRTNLPIELPP